MLTIGLPLVVALAGPAAMASGPEETQHRPLFCPGPAPKTEIGVQHQISRHCSTAIRAFKGGVATALVHSDEELHALCGPSVVSGVDYASHSIFVFHADYSRGTSIRHTIREIRGKELIIESSSSRPCQGMAPPKESARCRRLRVTGVMAASEVEYICISCFCIY